MCVLVGVVSVHTCNINEHTYLHKCSQVPTARSHKKDLRQDLEMERAIVRGYVAVYINMFVCMYVWGGRKEIS